MNDLSQDYESVLLADHEGPCVSLYQPTHRTFPDRKQDPIRFANLLKVIEASLERQYSNRDIGALMKPFRELEEDANFWNHTLDGIAVFATPDLFRVYNLQRTVKEKAIVADSFHTKPLMRILQSADRFHVLGISRHGAALYEGNRYALDEVDLAPDFPKELEDVVGREDNDPERANRQSGRDGSPHLARQGVNVRRELTENETRQFFRAVDEAVNDTYSKPSGLPLVLAALAEHHHMFREVSENRALMEEAIDVNPASLTTDELRERAWEVVLPTYLARLDKLVERFGTAEANDLGSSDLSEIGKAAASSRIETLLIDADRIIPGTFDAEAGSVAYARLEDPDVDDVLDDLGEHVVVTGGEVVIVPSEKMPTKSGLAAIYRF